MFFDIYEILLYIDIYINVKVVDFIYVIFVV